MRQFYADPEYYAPNAAGVGDDPVSDSEEAEGSLRHETDIETWQDYWSEELVALYHDAIDKANSCGWPILDKCTFHSFAEFCFKMSSGVVPR